MVRLLCIVVCRPVRLSGERHHPEILFMLGRRELVQGQRAMAGQDYEPQAGDLIFFDWGSNGSIDHVGIVEKCENGTVYTVGGNSGDACKQQSYSVGNSSIYGYGVPIY